MPTYQYQCENCGHARERTHSITKKPATALRCRRCGGRMPQHFGDPIMLVFGEPTTFGQQAERNAKALGHYGVEEHNQQVKEAGKARRAASRERLAEAGLKPIDTDKLPAKPWWRNGKDGAPDLDRPVNISKIPDVNAYIEHGKG